MARGHAIAAIVEDAAGEEGLGIRSFDLVIVCLLRRAWLEQPRTSRSVDNGRLFSCQNVTLEGNLANIEAIAQQVGERTAREGNAADLFS